MTFTVAFVARLVARVGGTRHVVPGHARRAHRARTIATFGCALAILAPHTLSVPRANMSSPAATSVAMAGEMTAAASVRSALPSTMPDRSAVTAIAGDSLGLTALHVTCSDRTQDRRPGGGATVVGGACSFERSAGGAGARNARVGVPHGWGTPGVPADHRRAATRPTRNIVDVATRPMRKYAREITATPPSFTIAKAPYEFIFPRDHASHPGYQSEWWYYTGHVRTKQGRRFGYELTFFRVGLRPGDPQPTATQSKWRGNELYPAHFALTDEQGKTFFHVDRFAREALGMGAASPSTLDVKADDWWLRGSAAGKADLERMTMHASEETAQGRNGIDFVQLPEKKPAVHGAQGVSRKAACASCASHYYSYTRLRTTGTLAFGGQRFAVDGVSWMDHEFGSAELQADQAGWDWFSIQLDDDREIMLYLLRQKDGGVTPQSSGSLIERDGSVRQLQRSDFGIEATGRWTSPHTGGVYPSGWRVRVAKAGVDVVLAPTVLDQELAGTSGGGISYWEGAVDVHDASGHARGVGYVELTGYAGTVSI